MRADRAAHADSAGQLQAPVAIGVGGWPFVTKEGCSWRAFPERFGPWHTVYMRGRRWIDKGVLERVFAELQRVELETQLEQAGPDRPLRVSLDSTIVKVHQDGMGAPANRDAPLFKPGAGYKGDETRALAAALGWESVTLPRANRRKPWLLNRAAYRARNAIERYFGRIKRLRGIANRYHKLAHVYPNQIVLACIHLMTR